MIPEIETFELSEGEKLHPLWLRLKAYLEGELQRLRIVNDKPKTELETARLRGRIDCTKAIIGLGADRPLTGE